MKEYAFETQLFGFLRVIAESEDKAREMVLETIDAHNANFGAWPDGEPIEAEVSAERLWLAEINGEEVAYDDERDRLEYAPGDLFATAIENEGEMLTFPAGLVMENVRFDLFEKIEATIEKYAKVRARKGETVSAQDVIATLTFMLAATIQQASQTPEKLPTQLDITAAALAEFARTMKEATGRMERPH